MVKIGICDDQVLFLAELEQQLHSLLESYGTVYSLHTYTSAMQLIDASETYDLLFLDIDMPELDGLSAAAYLRQHSNHTIIVFVSAVKDKVFETFRLRPLNFIVKPVDVNHLSAVLFDAMSELQSKKEDYAVFELHHGIHIKVKYSDLVYVETNRRGTRLHLSHQVYESTMKLTDVWTMLEGRDFFRIYTSFIVNLNSIQTYNRTHITTHDGITLNMSRDKYAQFKMAYLRYLKGKV